MYLSTAPSQQLRALPKFKKKNKHKKVLKKQDDIFCRGTMLCGVSGHKRKTSLLQFDLVLETRDSLKDKEHSFSLPWVLVFIMIFIPFRDVNTETALTHISSVWKMSYSTVQAGVKAQRVG